MPAVAGVAGVGGALLATVHARPLPASIGNWLTSDLTGMVAVLPLAVAAESLLFPAQPQSDPMFQAMQTYRPTVLFATPSVYAQMAHDADGSPDTELVTRLSRVSVTAAGQIGGTCKPVACTAGRVAAACNGADDDASCDSSPGAGDGECDACPITGGESTENEMFNLFGLYYVDPAIAAQDAAATAARLKSLAGSEAVSAQQVDRKSVV